jgi:hypothetical protein
MDNKIKAKEGKAATVFEIAPAPRKPEKDQVRLSLAVPLVEHLKRYAKKMGLSVNETVNRILQLYLKGK